MIGAGAVRSADWVVRAQPLYEADTADVVGARSWADLPNGERLEWFARADAYEHGRRLYERYCIDVPQRPQFDALTVHERDEWSREAMRRAGCAL